VGSKRDRNTQANLRRGREELVIMRQKVAAAEGAIADARRAADHRVGIAAREVQSAQARMKDHHGRMTDILSRLYLMQTLGEEQYKQAKGWLNNDLMNASTYSDEESLFTMFTQQHYTALAKILKETRQQVTDENIGAGAKQIKHEAISELQANLMKMLAKDNAKFKDLLFIAAASEHGPEK